MSPFCVALIHTGLGDRDAAFSWLNRAFEAHDHWMETLKVNSTLDSFRGDPPLAELLRKMEL